MGFRFQRRIKLFPGVTMNLGKTGASFSVGARGARMTFGKDGVRKTCGLPGTGLSYSRYSRYSSGDKSSSAPPLNSANSDEVKLDLSFFSKLFVTTDELAFVNGLKAFVSGNNDVALAELKKAYCLPDAAFTAGFIALNSKDDQEAVNAFMAAGKNSVSLGAL